VALLVAVQVQPLAAVTGIDPEPPAEPNVELVIAPAVTVQLGVLGVVSFFEHADAAMISIIPAISRREVIMRGSIH
jgi:hypothetical protein